MLVTLITIPQPEPNNPEIPMMNKKVFLKAIYLITVMGIFLCAGTGWAVTSSSGIFTRAYNTIHTTFENARSVVYVVSGFGLIGVAVGGIFGKISFRWLAMICIALAVLASADMIVEYSTKNGVEMDTDYRGIGYDDFKLDLQFKE